MAGTAATVAEFFANRVERYDEQMRLGVPRYGEMLDELTRSLPAGSSRILELGCGTGALTLRVAQRFPGAGIHAIDAVGEMIEIAQERIRAVGSQLRAAVAQEPPGISFEVASFEDAVFEPGAFDLVTASMSLHHLADKLPFYTRIRESLCPGGYFVFADELTGILPHVQALHWNDWESFARQPGHLSPQDLSDVLEHCEVFDHYETLPDQLALISNAGFESGDCIWRASNYSIFAAQVPRPSG